MITDYYNPKNWHPAANAFPLLSKSDPERFQELVTSVRENGLLEPVVLYEGKVLDGRNRLLACRKAGVEPTFEQFTPNGVGPVQWIAARHTRRDLDASQRAAAALALLPLLEAEARDRQLAALKKGTKLPVVDKLSTTGKSREQAAKLTGASEVYVRDAKRIVAKDASMLDKLRDGEVTIQEAKRQLGFNQNVAALMSDESNEWYTPKKYVEAARQVLGNIDLDPASCDAANKKFIKADTYYTAEHDGLKQPWSGRIWLNPPYGKVGPKFIAKLLKDYEAGNVTEAITVVNPHCTDTQWFQPLFNYLLCFTDHRPRFWNEDGEGESPNHGSVFVYLGKHPSKFASVFSRFGAIVKRYK